MSKSICPNCGKASGTARAPKAYHYRESGLRDLWLHGGVTEIKCSACGETSVKIEKEGQLLQVIAMGLLMSPPGMTGPEMRFVRGVCQVSQARLAESLGLPRRETVAEREGKKRPGLSFAEELGLRLVLVNTFLAFLEGKGNCLLTHDQQEELSKFVREFIKFSKVAVGQLREVRLEATLEDDWRLKKAA